MTPEQYWKFKSRILEYQNLEIQAKVLIDRATTIRSQAFKDAELEPTKNYKMDDEAQTVVEDKK